MKNQPLVYSCSGCSNVAQLANRIAVFLDRQELAEMSCIAGVGGHVKSLVKTAQSGRKIAALDGCPLHCVKNCLEEEGVKPTVHLDFSEYGLKKRKHEDASEQEFEMMLNQVVLPALASL